MATISAEIHQPVMALPPEDRHDREKVNEAVRRYQYDQPRLRSRSGITGPFLPETTTPLQPNILAVRRCFTHWALKSPSTD
jgi:hypothetical protein